MIIGICYELFRSKQITIQLRGQYKFAAKGKNFYFLCDMYLSFTDEVKENKKCGQMAAEKSSSRKYIGIIVVLLVVVLYLVSRGPITGAVTGKAIDENDPAVKEVKDFYKVITGSDAEVIKITEQNGLYRLLLKIKDTTGRDTVADVYLTRDGLFMIDRLIDVQSQKLLLVNQSAFAQCLLNKNVRILGL